MYRYWLLTNRVGKSLLAVALMGGLCVPGLAQSATGLSSLPLHAQGAISAALGKHDSAYWVHGNGAGFRAENARQALVAEFTREGAELRSHGLRWGIEMQGYGYGEPLHPVKAVAPITKANRVEYRRDGITEWYENGPVGLEQGFTLAHPPTRANSKLLTLELGFKGDLLPALEPGGKGLELKPKNGKATLRYTGLEARDATGRQLRSWLEVRGSLLLLRLDDRAARYPVVVDPWVQQAELTASDGVANEQFGWSVAVSGSTAVAGINAPNGAAFVFVEKGDGTWSQQAELTASDGTLGDQFGFSVAVSGGTAVVGAPNHTVPSNTTYSQGAAYVFVESGGTWTQQAELAASDGGLGDLFGSSVAVSGSTAVVGAHRHGSNFQRGAAYVFSESGGTWSQQGELTASDGAAYDNFGYSVAISGSTALVGAIYHTGSNRYQGAAYVFVGSGGTWTQQTELTASDGGSNDYFGVSVGISGSTALVGAPFHGPQGAAYVFAETGGTWTQQAELAAAGGAPSGYFGISVAVSGSTAVVGAVAPNVASSNGQQGTAYVFVQGSGMWSQQAELTASNETAADFFGLSVAIRRMSIFPLKVGDPKPC